MFRDQAARSPSMSQDQSGHQTQESREPISRREMWSFKKIKRSYKKQMAETDDNIHTSWSGTRQRTANSAQLKLERKPTQGPK